MDFFYVKIYPKFTLYKTNMIFLCAKIWSFFYVNLALFQYQKLTTFLLNLVFPPHYSLFFYVNLKGVFPGHFPGIFPKFRVFGPIGFENWSENDHFWSKIDENRHFLIFFGNKKGQKIDVFYQKLMKIWEKSSFFDVSECRNLIKNWRKSTFSEKSIFGVKKWDQRKTPFIILEPRRGGTRLKSRSGNILYLFMSTKTHIFPIRKFPLLAVP